ncbi:MAG TPA: tRNA glutamyl-Q(34) synthetase GluQRS [Burkholderiaceae bacterium]
MPLPLVTSQHRGGYRGRFAPSPTGLLHAGSLVAALASWLDARAHDGQWLVRIEDLDGPRCVPGADAAILGQLAALGMLPDEPPVWQSSRGANYEAALAKLVASGWAYPCGCTRSDIAQALAERGAGHARGADLVYPGTCRGGLRGRPARAVRLLVAPATAAPLGPLRIDWHDRRLAAQHQDVTAAVGDFVLRRAGGLWAYQLAVVVDDAAQGITHVVRGEDLVVNTPRQIHLQRVLGLPTPRYLHTPLVLGADGEKLSKQNGAQPIDASAPLAALCAAGLALSLHAEGGDPATWLASAIAQWRARWLE